MKRSAFYLLALLLALLAIWWWLGQREKLRQRGPVPEQAGFADSLTVSRFVLTRHNQPQIALEKDPDGFWHLTQPVADRANANFVRQLVVGLSTMQLLARVSSRESQFALFQIDDQQAARIQAFAGDVPQGDIYVGKLSPDGQHVYVRLHGGRDVYTATGGGAISAFRTRAVNDFRDRRIYELDLSVIDSLDVEGEDLHYRIARADTLSWKVRIGSGDYQDADRPVTESVLRAFGFLRASNFADDTLSLDWSRPLLTVRAWKLGGGTEKLEFLRAGEEENYWVRAEGRKPIYKVFQSAYQTFKREPATLLPSRS